MNRNEPYLPRDRDVLADVERHAHAVPTLEPNQETSELNEAGQSRPDGWSLRHNPQGHACLACGRQPPELYQGSRRTSRGWHELPGVVLCSRCFVQRVHRQTASIPERDASAGEPEVLGNMDTQTDPDRTPTHQ